MEEKVYNIASDDLGELGFSLEKIIATAQSAYSYLHLNNSICELSKQKNTVLCMFKVIEDLANAADNQLKIVADKLCKICREMKLQNEHTD